jgi:pilus assembly protein CpaB
VKTRIIGIVLAVALAVAGMFVLLAYARGADDRALADVRMTTVYVIKKEVPAGTAASSLGTYLATERIPAIGAVPARVTDLSQITGMVSTTRLEVGEQLIKPRWAAAAKAATGDEGLGIPKGYEALTVALPPERELGARIRTGDRVGVIATFGSNGQPSGLARQILHKVLVLEVQNPAASKTASAQNNPVLVTLAVQRADAELVAWDQQMGDIYLALQPPAALEGGRTVTLKALFP